MKDFIRNPAAGRNPLASHTIRESGRSLSLVCTLASLLSQLVFLRILLREEELHLHEGYKPTVVMSHKCYCYIIPQCLYKKQDLHLHGLVTYQPTSNEVMSIYRLSSRFERFHHSCSFFNLQHVKELFFSSGFRNLPLLYQNIRSCFRLSIQIFVEEGGIEPPSCSGRLRTHSQA